MHWIAPSEKDTASATLEKRLWDAAGQFRANSGRFLEVCALLAMSAGAALAAGDAAAAEPQPYLLKPEGQQFSLLKNWTFGNKRSDATVRNKAGLDQDFYYR